MIISLTIIAATSIIIWWFCNKIEEAAHVIGHYLKMPASVKGAVLYAIPSSVPELCTSIIAVLVLKTPAYAVGVGTIVGSAVFNILIIPAFSVFFAIATSKRKGKQIEGIAISSHVFYRDGIFYLIAVNLFIIIALTGKLSKMLAIIFLLTYAAYILVLYISTKKHKPGMQEDKENTTMVLNKALIWMALGIAAVGVTCYFLVLHTVKLSAFLHINPYVTAVIFTAAATSIPDTIISIAAAKKNMEESEESIVNAFASNIFDILVCLSIPALAHRGTFILDTKAVAVSLFLLLFSTFLILLMILSKNILTKNRCIILLIIYVVFIGSTVFNDMLLQLFSLA